VHSILAFPHLEKTRFRQPKVHGDLADHPAMGNHSFYIKPAPETTDKQVVFSEGFVRGETIR
jgi:hypothetical protein